MTTGSHVTKSHQILFILLLRVRPCPGLWSLCSVYWLSFLSVERRWCLSSWLDELTRQFGQRIGQCEVRGSIINNVPRCLQVSAGHKISHHHLIPTCHLLLTAPIPSSLLCYHQHSQFHLHLPTQLVTWDQNMTINKDLQPILWSHTATNLALKKPSQIEISSHNHDWLSPFTTELHCFHHHPDYLSDLISHSIAWQLIHSPLPLQINLLTQFILNLAK